MKRKYNYKMLKLKIKEIYDRQELFAQALGISISSLNQRLNNKTDWKGEEMITACDLLGISYMDIPKYFFVENALKTATF